MKRNLWTAAILVIALMAGWVAYVIYVLPWLFGIGRYPAP